MCSVNFDEEQPLNDAQLNKQIETLLQKVFLLEVILFQCIASLPSRTWLSPSLINICFE